MLGSCVLTLVSCAADGGETQPSQNEATTPAPEKKLAYSANEDNATCTITGLGECDSSELVIPKEIDGYRVTAIATKAFFNCANLTSITINDNITNIGENAFYGCSSLTSINISSLEAWLNISFEEYWSNPCYPGGQLYLNGELLTDVTIPNNITNIGNYAFAGNDHLISVVIPDSVTSIGNNAFVNYKGLTSVTIGDGVTDMGISVFSGCSSLTDINLPKNLTKIGKSAFSGCAALTSITIPGKVTEIGGFAFRGCTSLANIKFSSTVEKWMQVSRGSNWCTQAPATDVVCTNGTVDTRF